MGHKNKETDKKNLKLTDLSSVGEFGFIEHIKNNGIDIGEIADAMLTERTQIKTARPK